MKRKIDNTMKNQIEKVTLQLIDDNGGAVNVNLRNIARVIGCSPPNIYNYYDNLEDLFNSIMINICEDFKIHMKKEITKAENQEELLTLAFKGYIEYAINYPSRLNFFHFERINIKVFTNTQDSAESVNNSMIDLLNLGINGEVPDKKLQEITRFLHCYLIGELSGYITGRVRIEDKKTYIDSLVAYCNKMFKILTIG